MMLIGSSALQAYSVQLGRTPKDTDYICWQNEFDQYLERNKDKIVDVQEKKFGFVVFQIGSSPIEFEIAEKRESARQLLEMFPHAAIAPILVLYALKMSHRYLKNSKHFLKTMRDIQAIEGTYNITEINNGLSAWFKLREKETYDYSHPILNQKKGDFFADDFYVWDHDSIHEAVKLYDKPCYEYFKLDKADVLCSKDKFFSVDEKYRMGAVYEESCVLALERCLINHDFKTPPKKAFLMALQKVCTSITSGWFREYAWRNWDNIVKLFDNLGETLYVDKFNDAKEKGELKAWVKP